MLATLKNPASIGFAVKTKKAASIEKADNKNLQVDYTTEVNLFAKYKERLQQAAIGEQEARNFRWHTFSIETCQEALRNYISLAKQPEYQYRARGWALVIAREIIGRHRLAETNDRGSVA